VIPGVVGVVSSSRVHRRPDSPAQRVTQYAEQCFANVLRRRFFPTSPTGFPAAEDYRRTTTIMSLNTAHVQGGGCLIHAGEWWVMEMIMYSPCDVRRTTYLRIIIYYYCRGCINAEYRCTPCRIRRGCISIIAFRAAHRSPLIFFVFPACKTCLHRGGLILGRTPFANAEWHSRGIAFDVTNLYASRARGCSTCLSSTVVRN